MDPENHAARDPLTEPGYFHDFLAKGADQCLLVRAIQSPPDLSPDLSSITYQ